MFTKKFKKKIITFTFSLIIFSIFISFNCIAFSQTKVGGNIFEDTVWTKENSPYIVTTDIYVQHSGNGTSTLTIEPGVEINFSQNTGLYIGWTNNGALNAIGTEEDPILFTSNSSSGHEGSWKSITFTQKTTVGLSKMKHCIVEYGGYNVSASIICHIPVQISDSVIKKSNGYPIKVLANDLKIKNLVYQDNEIQATCLYGNISTDTIWANNGDESIYVVINDVYVQHTGSDITKLTIEPGVEVRFEQNTGLYIGWTNNGALYAKGTEEEPIIFTSNSSPVYPGAWEGIQFTTKTITTVSRMEKCIIEYGGHNLGASIHCSLPVSIVDCVIKKSKGYPIRVLSNDLQISKLKYRGHA